MIKHTPGPWTVEYDKETDREYIEGPWVGNFRPCVCRAPHRIDDLNLVLSAPELLASLKQLETAASLIPVVDNGDNNPDAVRLRTALGFARAIIKKAEGTL